MSTPPKSRRWQSLFFVGLGVLVIAVTALFVATLLGTAGEDRLGKLRPVDPSLSAQESERVVAPKPKPEVVPRPAPVAAAPTSPPAERPVTESRGEDSDPDRESDRETDESHEEDESDDEEDDDDD